VLFGGTEAVSITRVPSAAFFGGAEAVSPAGAPSAVFSVTTEAPAAVRSAGAPFPPGVTMVELAQVTRAASAPSNDAVSSVMMSSFVGVDDAFVGGAQLKTLSPDLRTALALPEGVLVLQVLRGTPAAESGLREGDLIRSANGQDVRRVDDVQRALVQGREQRALALRVARKGAAERTVTLRW
jgi:S1-C subfamily serine protease